VSRLSPVGHGMKLLTVDPNFQRLMSLWFPRTSQVVLSRSYTRIRVRSSLPLALHPRFQSSKSSPTTNVTSPHHLDPSLSSSNKPSPPTPKDATHASLLTRAWKKVKHEAAHYWNGTKLLVSEVRISSRLQWKILQGEALTRRERRQVLCLLKSPQKHLCSMFFPS
jgi:LETM1 and EF-hand domain-containing protein 1, mitochondrial